MLLLLCCSCSLSASFASFLAMKFRFSSPKSRLHSYLLPFWLGFACFPQLTQVSPAPALALALLWLRLCRLMVIVLRGGNPNPTSSQLFVGFVTQACRASSLLLFLFSLLLLFIQMLSVGLSIFRQMPNANFLQRNNNNNSKWKISKKFRCACSWKHCLARRFIEPRTIQKELPHFMAHRPPPEKGIQN